MMTVQWSTHTPYVEPQTSLRGERAVIKSVGTPTSVVVGYARLGLRPEDFAEEVHSALAPAMVYYWTLDNANLTRM